MNDNKEILEEILSNTKETKEVIVKKFKPEEKAKTSKAKAESKFKMIGAKFNLEMQDKISDRLKKLDINQNSYIKELVRKDLEENNIMNVNELIKNLSFIEKIKILFINKG